MRSLLFASSLSLCVAFSAGMMVTAPQARAQEPVPAVAKEARAAADAAWAKQDFEAAAQQYQKVVDANPKDGEAWHRLGFALHGLGKLEAALVAHEKAAEFPRFAGHGCYNAACVYALQGHKDKAIAWLGKAADAGLDLYDHIQSDSDMDSLRDDPRFAKILAKIEKNAAGGGGALQVYVQTTPRKRNRVAWFGGQGSPGQLTFEYAALPWNEKYDAMVGAKKLFGKKWRLGSDFWTSLDSSIAMTVGGVEVPAGYYYLTLEQRDAKTFILALHDAADVKKKKLDAYVADRLQGGIEIPLTHARSDEAQEQLDIGVMMAPNDKANGTLHVRFGGHDLHAPVEVMLDR